MKKIPSVFQRDLDQPKALYLPTVTPGCEWVLRGEGVATRKWDGTACAIIQGQLFARYDSKIDKKTGVRKPIPYEGAIPCQEPDEVTGHYPHWVLVVAQPEFQWVKLAYETTLFEQSGLDRGARIPDGTYEACGPKIGTNHEELDTHILLRHGTDVLQNVPRTFDGLKSWLGDNRLEGIVFHHEDGRMAKATRQGFGIPWGRVLKRAQEG